MLPDSLVHESIWLNVHWGVHEITHAINLVYYLSLSLSSPRLAPTREHIDHFSLSFLKDF